MEQIHNTQKDEQDHPEVFFGHTVPFISGDFRKTKYSSYLKEFHCAAELYTSGKRTLNNSPSGFMKWLTNKSPKF